MDGSELLQTAHLSEAEHSAFSSSKRQVGILRPIVTPAARFLPIGVADDFHCSAIGTHFVRHNHFWPAVALHCFSEKFQCCVAVSALGYITFKHLTFVINGSPKVMRLSADLYKNLIRCHCQFEYDRIQLTRFLRISAANIGPNLFHQNRTVSWLISTPRSCKKSSTLWSESGKQTYSITARRMISGLVLKCLNGECFVIRRGYETARPVSSWFCLTVPACNICHIIILPR